MENNAALLANLLFSETKNLKDAHGILNVVNNRLARPKRFGETYQDVIFAEKQFSGVGTNEWNKAVNQQFTEKEAEIYKEMLALAQRSLTGQLEDITGGADHYANVELLKKRNSTPSWVKQYQQTSKIGEHTYFSETGKRKSESKSKETFSSAFSKARKAGKKTFTWNDNSYTTDLK